MLVHGMAGVGKTTLARGFLHWLRDTHGLGAGVLRLTQIDPEHYGGTRNYLNGKVTRLSSYIRHGILSLNHVCNIALETGG